MSPRHLGVDCCKTCAELFHKYIVRSKMARINKKAWKEVICKNNLNCKAGCKKQCKKCRFDRCLRAGMTYRKIATRIDRIVMHITEQPYNDAEIPTITKIIKLMHNVKRETIHYYALEEGQVYGTSELYNYHTAERQQTIFNFQRRQLDTILRSYQGIRYADKFNGLCNEVISRFVPFMYCINNIRTQFLTGGEFCSRFYVAPNTYVDLDVGKTIQHVKDSPCFQHLNPVNLGSWIFNYNYNLLYCKIYIPLASMNATDIDLAIIMLKVLMEKASEYMPEVANPHHVLEKLEKDAHEYCRKFDKGCATTYWNLVCQIERHVIEAERLWTQAKKWVNEGQRATSCCFHELDFYDWVSCQMCNPPTVKSS
ncbi:hypothetical protein QR680_000358 [Steinernema hermaphroditum]|uniref:Nuclear receptor domain-containing protein n=1 Tax=Steinernema hermaphroditum TaxID=289476 RepID=A0AA39GUH2_9BILA|nr:hypothetical protein QR680_000358 [Steinernema hermaphroditum]